MTYYSDIDLNFRPHPMTGDISLLVDEHAVKRALTTIGDMQPWDIPFQPDFHGHVRELLFELPSAATEAALASRIEWAFNKLEPRANIIDVIVRQSHDEGGYDIRIVFSVKSLLHEQEVRFYLERIR